jgi:CDP-diacylglycerol--serine O-phosphatidyltransferase
MIPVLSAWRLAKFNIDDRQTDHFIGLPTPAYAMVVASFPMIVLYHVNYEASWMMKIISLIYNPIFLAVFSGLFSILLVAPIRLFALKFKNFRWQHNEIRYIFLISSLVLLIWLLLLAIPLIIILYILLSVIIRKTIHSEEAEG